MATARAEADQAEARSQLWDATSFGKQFHNEIHSLNVIAKSTVEKHDVKNKIELII